MTSTESMNDHDLLIKVGAQLEYLIKEVQSLRDGVKKDITDIQLRVDMLEKRCISIENDNKTINQASVERAAANSLRITALEAQSQLGVTKSESNRAYIWRKAFEWIMPFLFILAGTVLAKLGILNLS